MNIMKTIAKYSIYALLLMVAVSCQQEELLKYDAARAGLNIWVGTSTGSVYEETTYNYSYALEEGSISFYARIYGVPTEYDRYFTLEPFGDSIEQIVPTIRVEEYVMPAGAISGEYKVYFNSKFLPSDDLFKTTDGCVSFRMKQNDTFDLGAETMQSFKVILRNRIAKPRNWDSANYPQVALSKYFGPYSDTKYRFMIECLGLVDFKISYSASTALDEANNTVSTAYAVYLQQLMQEKLAEYNETSENPLMDKNGNVISFDI